MSTEETFDSFYRATRGALLHQTFALTGDLPAALSAVRDAYIAGWHHWRKINTLEDPSDWVRPRAWRLAQRRHTARILHRNKSISDRDRSILGAIASLPSAQRTILLLSQLAAVPLPAAARELTMTLGSAEQHLQSATANFAAALDVDSTSIRIHLHRLADVTADVALPRPSTIRRAGGKRRTAHTVLAAAAALAVAVASGAFAYEPNQPATQTQHQVLPQPAPSKSPTAPTALEPGLPTAGNLLDSDQIARLGSAQSWRSTTTGTNTSGTGINTICQQSRFADPKGISALVRRFRAEGHPARSAVQTVEVSRSATAAKRTFATTLDWYASCQVARLQLLTSYRVDHTGDAAMVLLLRVWKKPITTYSVAVARIGEVTTSTVARTAGGSPPPVRQAVQSLADAVAMLCGTSGSPTCQQTPVFSAVPPPPSGAERGILAVTDLPPVGRIGKPWVGTESEPVGATNPAATTCDRASFADARRARTRTFLIPQAQLPARFGLAETTGVFRSPRRAARFMAAVRGRIASCEDRDLATSVSHAATQRGPHRDLSTWQLRTSISKREAVRFRIGFVRVGDKVAQLTFAPTARDDMSSTQFRGLLLRAGDRLDEIRPRRSARGDRPGQPPRIGP